MSAARTSGLVIILLCIGVIMGMVLLSLLVVILKLRIHKWHKAPDIERQKSGPISSQDSMKQGLVFNDAYRSGFEVRR